jgi:hypothetical protein
LPSEELPSSSDASPERDTESLVDAPEESIVRKGARPVSPGALHARSASSSRRRARHPARDRSEKGHVESAFGRRKNLRA